MAPTSKSKRTSSKSKRTSSKKKRTRLRENDTETYKHLLDAVADVKENKLSLRKASEKYGIAKTTIHNRVAGKIKGVKRGPSTLLTKAEEQAIVDFLHFAEKEAIPVTLENIYDIAEAILLEKARNGVLHEKPPSCKKGTHRPSGKWWKLFVKRHPNVSTRRAENPSISKDSLMQWFTSVKEYFTENNMESVLSDSSRHITLDESGFSLEPTTKVLVLKGQKNDSFETSGEEKNITLLGVHVEQGCRTTSHKNVNKRECQTISHRSVNLELNDSTQDSVIYEELLKGCNYNTKSFFTDDMAFTNKLQMMALYSRQQTYNKRTSLSSLAKTMLPQNQVCGVNSEYQRPLEIFEQQSSPVANYNHAKPSFVEPDSTGHTSEDLGILSLRGHTSEDPDILSISPSFPISIDGMDPGFTVSSTKLNSISKPQDASTSVSMSDMFKMIQDMQAQIKALKERPVTQMQTPSICPSPRKEQGLKRKVDFDISSAQGIACLEAEHNIKKVEDEKAKKMKARMERANTVQKENFPKIKFKVIKSLKRSLAEADLEDCYEKSDFDNSSPSGSVVYQYGEPFVQIA